MAEIINLNRARKARAKAEAKRDAQNNRVIHGRTRAEKDGARCQRDNDRRRLDGAKLEENGAPDEKS